MPKGIGYGKKAKGMDKPKDKEMKDKGVKMPKKKK